MNPPSPSDGLGPGMSPSGPEGRRSILWLALGDRSKASSRVRGYWLERPLLDEGFTSSWVIADSRRRIALAALRALTCDTVVFQKQYSRWHVALAKLFRRLGKVVIFDIDDTPSWNANPRTVANAEVLFSVASVVTAGCENLCDYASRFNSNVHLVPSCVDLAAYDVLEPPLSSGAPVTIGWIGNGKTYGEDIVEILGPSLRTVAEQHPVTLRVVGTLGSSLFEDELGSIPGLTLELIESIDWASEHATRDAMRGVDLGVYPLRESVPNSYKCGFKGIEYMALGLPVVASDCRSHRALFRDGVDGFLCADEAQWTAALTELVVDPLRRQQMGREARAHVVASWSTGAAAEAFTAAINSAHR